MNDPLLDQTWSRTRQSAKEEFASFRGLLLAGRTDEARLSLASLQDLLRAAALGHALDASRYLSGDLTSDAWPLALMRLERELDRLPDHLPERDGPPLESVWVSSQNLAFLDRLTVAAANRGWQLVSGYNPPERGPCILDLPVEETLEVLQQLGPDTQSVVTAPQVTGELRVQLCRAGAELVVGADTPAEQLLELAARTQARRRSRQPRVLMVDDDVITRRVVARILQRGGYQVFTLADSGDFWAQLEQVQPDLLLFDLYLPGVLGTDLCRAVRSHPAWSAVPILFLTSSRDADTVSQVFTQGADDFLTKPVDAPDLLGRLNNRLSRSSELRAYGDIDPHTSLPGRARTLEQVSLLWSVARRQGRSLALCLLESAEQPVWGDCDVLGKLDDTTWLACAYDQGREDMRRHASQLHTLRSVVAAFPADGTEPLHVLATMVGLIPSCLPGQPRELHRAPRHLALVQHEFEASDELVLAMSQRGWLVERLPDWHAVQSRLALSSWRPDLLLLDADLPMFDTLRFMHQFSASARCPVMIMAQPDPELALRLTEAGAQEVLAKPLAVDVLADRLARRETFA